MANVAKIKRKYSKSYKEDTCTFFSHLLIYALMFYNLSFLTEILLDLETAIDSYNPSEKGITKPGM